MRSENYKHDKLSYMTILILKAKFIHKLIPINIKLLTLAPLKSERKIESSMIFKVIEIFQQFFI